MPTCLLNTSRGGHSTGSSAPQPFRRRPFSCRLFSSIFNSLPLQITLSTEPPNWGALSIPSSHAGSWARSLPKSWRAPAQHRPCPGCCRRRRRSSAEQRGGARRIRAPGQPRSVPPLQPRWWPRQGAEGENVPKAEHPRVVVAAVGRCKGSLVKQHWPRLRGKKK